MANQFYNYVAPLGTLGVVEVAQLASTIGHFGDYRDAFSTNNFQLKRVSDNYILILDTDYSFSGIDAFYTDKLGFDVYTEIEILNPIYNDINLERTCDIMFTWSDAAIYNGVKQFMNMTKGTSITGASNDIPTDEAVKNYTDGKFITLSTTQTVSGAKTFSSATVFSNQITTLSHASAEILMDGVGNAALKRITCNDGGGNWNFKSGVYFDVADKYVASGGGAANMVFSSNSGDGKIVFEVATVGANAGDLVTWANTMTFSTTDTTFSNAVKAPTFTEGGTNLVSKYLGINANAVSATDSSKLGGTSAGNYLKYEGNISWANADTTLGNGIWYQPVGGLTSITEWSETNAGVLLARSGMVGGAQEFNSLTSNRKYLRYKGSNQAAWTAWRRNMELEATKTAGEFYSGTTAPSGTTRLNYDGYMYATRFYGAVWNDIVDMIEVEDDLPIVMGKAYARTEHGHCIAKGSKQGLLGIASDTFGHALGIRDDVKQLPLAIGGFVLAFTDKIYPSGTPLTANRNGDLTKASMFIKMFYPERILATFYKREDSDNYENLDVDGRHWVKVK